MIDFDLMMRRLTVSLIAGAATAAAMAHTWTLDSCINHAVEHNLTVVSRQLSEEQGRLEVTEARDAYLPSLSANASQNFDFGRGLTSSNMYANRNTSTFGWSVGLQLPLFQGLQAYRREQLAKANLAMLVEQTEAAREDVTLNVMASYLQALYCRELRDVAAEQVSLSVNELNRREVLLEHGKIAESEVYEARAQLAADSLTLVTSENDVTMALVDLSRLLRVEYNDQFDIAPLGSDERVVPDAETVYRRAMEHNHSIAAARLNMKAAEKQISLAKAGYLPKLSFNLGAGSSYYKLNGEENPTFARQMRDNYATSLGFTLSVPIFDAFSTRNSIRRARVQRMQAEVEYENAADELHRNIREAYYQAAGAERKLASASEAVRATKASFDAMTAKYRYGAANATEYEQQKTAYIKAVAEEVQARYERILRTRILDFYARN